MPDWKYAVSYARTAPLTAPLPLAGDLFENLETAAKHGYSGLEVHGREDAVYDFDGIKKFKAEHGAGISCIVTGRLHTEGKVSLLDEPVYSYNAAINGLKQYIDIAEKFGVDIIIGWIKGVIPPAADREQKLDILAGRLGFLNSYAKDRGVKLHIEVINRYETNIFNTARETLDFINKYGLDNCDIHLDTFHMGIEEPDPVAAIKLCGNRLGYFHAADNHRRYPGSGQLDFKKILAALRDVNYKGYVTVESMPWPDRETTIIRAMEHLKKCEP